MRTKQMMAIGEAMMRTSSQVPNPRAPASAASKKVNHEEDEGDCASPSDSFQKLLVKDSIPGEVEREIASAKRPSDRVRLVIKGRVRQKSFRQQATTNGLPSSS